MFTNYITTVQLESLKARNTPEVVEEQHTHFMVEYMGISLYTSSDLYYERLFIIMLRNRQFCSEGTGTGFPPLSCYITCYISAFANSFNLEIGDSEPTVSADLVAVSWAKQWE